MTRNRVVTSGNDFFLAANIARSEATRTVATVTLQVGGIRGGDEFGEGYCVVPGARAEIEKTEKSFTRRRP